MTKTVEHPTLFKRASNGSVQEWRIWVEAQPDGTGVIVVEHGKQGGKKQVTRDHIKEGKNTGKKNATTALEQAYAEATAKHTKQRDRKQYGLTVEESDAKKALAPMLAHKYEDYANQVDWNDADYIRVQPKFDGHRCLAIASDSMDIKLFSRKGEEIVSCDHIKEQLFPVMDAGMILDGELYIHGKPLNKIGSLVRKKQAGSADLCFMLYDINDTERPFVERFDRLQWGMYAQGSTHVQLAKTVPAASLDEAVAFQAQCLDNSYEGAMLRHGRTGYRPGDRSTDLLKMKTFVDAEFPVVGCREGRGGAVGMAIFECVTDAGHKFEVTSPGTHAQKRHFWDNHQDYIGKRLTVKYQTMTSTDTPVPFLPVAKGFVD